MSIQTLSQGIGVVPGHHNTTGPKASKIDRVIGYLMRKRKSYKSIQVDTTEKPKEYILPSNIGLNKLKNQIVNKNRYDVLGMDLADREMLIIEENHWDPDGLSPLGGTTAQMQKEEFRQDGIPAVDSADTRVIIKPQRRKSVKHMDAQCEGECQTCGFESAQADFKTYDKQLEALPRRLIAKLKARKNNRFVYSQLLNFLRCKHFMHVRDTHFITTLVADARAWLLKNNYTMENAIDYAILATAVQQAFIVSAEELEFRATLKNPKVRDHIDHHNATMSGDLGRVHMFQGGKHALAKAARRPFMRNLHLVAPRPDLV